LYHIQNDPLETKNLARDAGYKDILDTLRKECDAQIQRYRNARIIPAIKYD
jgi:hypothetical protein